MITLGGIELPDDLIWDNEFSWIPVAGASARTLGGTLLSWSNSISKGRPIDLVANESRGWMTRSQIQSLYSMASVSGTTFELNYKTAIYNVRFRLEDQPVLEAVPLISSRVNFISSDLYTGRIKLIEVE